MSWVEQIQRRARMLHDEIAMWRSRADEMGIDADAACAPFYVLLEDIYGEDMPLAKARDNSDLLLRVEGKAVEHAPSISLVSGLFNNVKTQVRGLTKVIIGLAPDHRVSRKDIDLGISGLAKGSLYVGFTVPLPSPRDDTPSLLGTEDPLYKATKDALKVINTVSHNIELRDCKIARNSDPLRAVFASNPDPL